MGLVQNFQKAITSMFASYVEVTNSTGIDTNPIVKTLENMNTRPNFKTNDGTEYLAFGKSDDVDQMIDKMNYKSPTHSGIITKKAKMISGSGLEVNSQLIGTKDAKLNVLFKHAGGANVSLYQIVTQMAFEYTRSGAVGLIVDFGDVKKGKKIPDGIVQFTVAPARHMRFVKPANDGDPYTEILYKKSFKVGALVADGEVIPMFNPFEVQKRAIIYIRNPYSVLDSYGIPNWIGAFNFIEADFEFGVQIENAAKNGFAPKTHVTMIGRNMSKKEKEDAAGAIQDTLSGSRGDQVACSFVARESEKPIIDIVQANNLDSVIETMSRLNDNKILTAHNITSPTLFGVMVSGQTMGGTGTEMISAYNLFKATETVPDRKMIIDALESAFEVTELVGVEIEVIDEDIQVDFKTQPIEGGNTESNPDTSSNAASTKGTKAAVRKVG